MANYFNPVQHIKTSLKSFSKKDIYISHIGNHFLGFVIKLTNSEQKRRFEECRRAVNVSPWETVYGYIKPRIKDEEFPIIDIREELINEYLVQ